MDTDLESTLALRAELEERNIELKVKGNHLALKAPSGKLPDALRAALIAIDSVEAVTFDVTRLPLTQSRPLRGSTFFLW